MAVRAAYRIHWLGILLAIIATDASAQTNGANAKVITWQPASSNAEVYVGILGEVHKPGVYHLEAGNLSLQNVIRRAGGMVEEASGTIRIVRQDRVVESLFFNPHTNVSVLPNDLLIIESKRTQAAISKMYESDPRMRAMYANNETGRKSPGLVQVALVNVLDRPVTINVKPEFAHVGHVVQMLDQPIELAQAVRVIGPERMLTQSAAPLAIDAPLSDGSVLVFPRNAINRSRLPAVPPAYESEIASGAIPSLIGGATGQSPELRNVGQLPPMMARQSHPGLQFSQPAAEPITIPAAPVINAQPPASERLEIPQPIQTPVVSTPPRIATIPFTGERRITSSSRQMQTTSEVIELPKQPKPEIEESSTTKGSRSESKKRTIEEPSLSDDELIPDEETSTGESGKAGGLSVWLLLSITAISGVLIGVAIWARRHFDGKPPIAQGLFAEIDAVLQQRSGSPIAKIESIPQASAAPIIDATAVETKLPAMAPLASESTWFEQLLKDQLPIREEKIEFPAEISLQGHIVPPPILRVDAASQPLGQGPHFTASAMPEQIAESPIESSSIPEQSTNQADLGHGKRPPKPHFLGRRAGENTIAAAAMAAKATSAPEIKSSSTTPVADALRHLQGGQS